MYQALFLVLYIYYAFWPPSDLRNKYMIFIPILWRRKLIEGVK